MSFGRREPAWRRNQERRAERERQDHEARRRRLAGLAPLPTPSDGARYRVMEDTSATTFTIPSMHGYADMYRHYINGNQVTSYDHFGNMRWPISDMNRVVVTSQPGVSTIPPPPIPAPEREPEPTAMEAWRD